MIFSHGPWESTTYPPSGWMRKDVASENVPWIECRVPRNHPPRGWCQEVGPLRVDEVMRVEPP